MDKKKLGLKIRLARTERNLSQTELAKRIGATQKRISHYETGESIPSLETLLKMAETLEKPVNYFID